jgi:hypothetical protein
MIRCSSLVLLFSWLCYSSAQAAPTVIQYGPIGTQRLVQSVYLRFSEDISGPSRKDLADPVNITCTGTEVQPKGQWINSSEWSAQIGNATMNDGITCVVVPNPVSTLKQEPVSMPKPWTFNTGGPLLVNSIPSSPLSYFGASDQEPVMAFLPNGPVDPKSLRNLRCTVDHKSIPVSILDGEQREQAFARLLKHYSAYAEITGWIVARCGTRPWRANSAVVWSWGAKIATTSGLANTEAQRIEIRPALPFTAYVGCRRFFGIKGCDPRLSGDISDWDLTVHFSEQVHGEMLQAIVLHGSAGSTYRQRDVGDPVAESDTISFPGPFVEGETLRLELPAKLVDINGRVLSNPDVLKRPIPVAHVPAYIAFPRSRGIVQWRAGTTATLPMIAQNTEGSIKVRGWQFDGAVENTPALLALHASLNDPKLMAKANFVNLAHGFSFSDTLLKNLSSAIPSIQERTIDIPGDGTQFISLPLEGYGTWLIEADSAAYRDALARQLKELRRRASTWANIVVDIDFDGALYLNGANIPDQATLKNQLRALKESINLQTSAISVHPNKLAPHRVVTAVRKIVNDSGLTVVPAPKYSTDNGAKAIELQEIVMNFGLPDNETRAAIVQLTNLNVHVQAMAENKVAVWVTALDSGKPVTDATVELWSAERTRLEEGKTDPHGLAVIKQPIGSDTARAPGAAWIVVRNGPDIAVHGLQITQNNSSLVVTHTILERTVYQAGDTLSMHHLLRSPGNRDWSFVPKNDEFTLRIYDANDRNTPLVEQAVTWREGSASTTWKIPASASAGTYVYELADAGNSAVPSGGMFRIEEMQEPDSEIKSSCTNQATGSLRGRAVHSPAHALTERMSLWIEQPKPWDATINVQIEPENGIVNAQAEESVSIDAVSDQGGYATLCTLMTDKQGKGHCAMSMDMTQKTRWTIQAHSDNAPTAALRVEMPLVGNTNARPILQWEEDSAPSAGDSVRLRIRSPFVPASMLLTIDHDGFRAAHAYEIGDAEQLVTLPTAVGYAPGMHVVARFAGDTINPSLKVPGSAKKDEQASLDLMFDNTKHRLLVDVSAKQGTPSAQYSTVLAVKVKHAVDGKAAAKGKITVFVVDNAFLLKNPNPSWSVLERFWTQADQVSVTADGPLAPSSLSTSLAEAKADYEQGQAGSFLFGAPTEPNPRLRQNVPVITAVPTPISVNVPTPAGSVLPSAMASAPSQTTVDKAPISESTHQQKAAAGTGAKDTAATSRASTPAIALPANAKPGECANTTPIAFSMFDLKLNEQGEASIPVSLPSMSVHWRVVAIATDGSDHFGTGEAMIQAIPNSPQ